MLANIKIMEKVNKLSNSNFVKILVGSSISIFISILFFFIFASILTSTDVPEGVIPSVIITEN